MARRAESQAKSNSSANISLSQPSRAPPSHKTLIQIAEERQLLNREDKKVPIDHQSITTTTINPDGSLSSNSILSESSSDDQKNATPFLDVLLYTFTLTVLHFTLTLLVHNQYAPEPPSLGPLLLSSTLISLTPTLLFVLVFVLHPRSSHLATQALFAAMSILAGGWLVYASNEEPYLAIMKKAPVLGTLWIWAIVEMKWEWAVACLSVVGGWGFWKGYTVI